jgi:3D (Asp-Asp-Asp) domain-containing protein
MTVYADGELNLRTGPGTEYDLVRVLAPGDAIDVVAVTDNGWYRTYNGNYVSSSHTTTTPPAAPSTVPQTEATAAPTAAPTTAAPVETQGPAPAGSTTTCTITFYGPQPLGDGTYSTTTATGSTCTQGRTCAADWSIYPPGTVIYIANDPLGGDGYYTVEDRGPGVNGNHIDIYVDDVSAYSTTSRDVSVA